MADSKLSALTAAGAFDDADLFYVVQGGVSYNTTWAAIKAAVATAVEYPEVANYAALPAAGSHTGEIYVVLASQGTGWLFTLKDSGFYYSDGAAWTRLGALPADYFTDSVMYMSDNSDPTKVLKFELSSISGGTTRTLTVPDASGTIALLTDIDARAGRWTGAFDGQGSVITSGVSVFKQVFLTGTITKAALVGDAAGEITLTFKRYTPSAGALGSATTLGTIALASTQHDLDTVSWSVTAGDVLEILTGGTISTVTRVNYDLSF